ncbi:MAG: hypothetical protein ACQESU_05190 [Halobacteriota archaeon]
MDANKKMPTKYWPYVWFVLSVLILVFYSTFSPEDLIIAVLMTAAFAAFVTFWLAVVHLIWFSDSLLYKLIAIIFGGLFAVVAVVIIQFVYEKFVFERSMSVTDY